MKNKKDKVVGFDERCLISCDLDGTLLNSKGEISEFSKKVITKLINKGHIFCINTARPFNSAAKYYKELGLTTPIVCHNGAYLFSPYECDFIGTNWCLSHQVLKEILSMPKLVEMSSNILIDAEKTAYIYNKSEWPTRKIYTTLNELGIYTTDHMIKLNEDMEQFRDTAFSIIIAPKSQDSLMDIINMIKVKVPTVITTMWKISQSIGSVIKVSCPYCSKGMALQLLSSYYGIPEFRCYAFGDGRDDGDMLKFASHGYAMKNGNDDAQIRANFITQYNNDNDGVARTLNKELKLGFRQPK